MDRGRAGGFITDNNYFGVQLKRKQRLEHIHRLSKIKNRKPGTSVTLDNTAPEVVSALKSDPRKVALREHFNFVTEAENKSLLKRIFTILTAPPKITDKEYQEMKKLCKSSKDDPRAKFEKSITEHKLKTFFQQVGKTGAYYSAKKWEDEYKHQKKNQRFMRQVKYQRPPGFVDKFSVATEAEPSPVSQGRRRSFSPSASADAQHDRRLTTTSSAAHVHRVRARREGRDVASTGGPGDPLSSSASASSSAGPGAEGGINGSADGIPVSVFKGNDEGFDHDFFFNEAASEPRHELGSLDRIIKITREPGPLDSAEAADDDFLPGRVTCYLMRGEAVVIVAEAHSAAHGGSIEVISAEAEISLADLAVIGDCPPGEALDDDSLRDLALDIIENVELRREGEKEARLVLSLVNEATQDDGLDGMDPVSGGGGGGVGAGRPIDPTDATSVASEEEVLRMLLPDRPPCVLDCGLRLLVTYNLLATGGPASFTSLLSNVARAGGAKPEHVFALVKVTLGDDDHLLVTAMVVSATQHVFKKGTRMRAAVPTGSVLTLTSSVPSLVQADPELVVSFAENLVCNMKIEHDPKSGDNVLLLQSAS